MTGRLGVAIFWMCIGIAGALAYLGGNILSADFLLGRFTIVAAALVVLFGAAVWYVLKTG
jgi:hypothetical protein